MKSNRLILSIFFFVFSVVNVQLTVANPAVEVAAEAAKTTWGQKLFDHSLKLNPYSIVEAIYAYPGGAVLSTIGILAVLTTLRSTYHNHYNKRARTYEEIVAGIATDLGSSCVNNKVRVVNLAAGLKDSYLIDLVDKFYKALESKIRSTTSTTVHIARGAAPGLVHGSHAATHTPINTSTALHPEDILRDINRYTLGEGNFVV